MATQDDFEERLASATSVEELAAIEAEMRGESAGRWEVKTLSEVANFLGLQTATVREFRTLPEPMPGCEGHWDLQAIVKWRYERLAAKSSGRSAGREALENRILAAKADRIEMTAQSERGELVARSAAKTELAEILNSAKLWIEQIPSELGPIFPSEIRGELSHALQQQINLILRKMSHQRAAMATATESESK